MQKGVDAGAAIRELLAERDWKIKDLAEKTTIRANTVALYATENDDARRPLGIDNGRKIAAAFQVNVTRLGLPGEEGAASEATELRRGLAALEEAVRLLTQRVEVLERKRATPRRGVSAPRRKAG